MLPPPFTVAASRVPSLEEAMEDQPAAGAPDGVQVTPPFVEV